MKGKPSRGEEGATLTEYALLLLLIAVGVLAAIQLVSGKISTMLTDIAGTI